MPWPIIIAFFLSGFAGLMHEIVWSRLLATLIGTTAHAQAAVLVVYMGGLALGSVLFGRRSDRRGNALRTYMLLEFAIAAYCLVLPLILGATALGYVWVASYVFESATLKFVLRFALALATILLPAILMGGTLPLLARHLIGRPRQTQRLVAMLYALNNFGAVLGAAVAGFITLPSLGVYASLFVASATNAIAGGLVWPWIGRETANPESAPRPEPAARDAATYGSTTYVVALLALVLSGFAAMGYEVVFIRVINLAFGATTYSFTVMLMSFITGIGLGSLLLTQMRIERPLWLFGLCQLMAAGAFIAATPLMERLPYYVALVRIGAHESGGGFLYYQAGKALLCLAVLLAPTMCLGASFPLVAAVQARHPSQIGSEIGTTYACNTLGNVLGVLVTTLFLLPTIGMLGSFHVSVGLSVMAGLMALAVASEMKASARAGVVVAIAAILTVYTTNGRGWPVPLLYGFNHINLQSGPPPDIDEAASARHPASSFEAWKRMFVLDPVADREIFLLEEEAHANVLAATVRGSTRLIVNTKTDASTSGGDLETQLILAHAPLFMQPAAKSLLVIGYGSGITLGSALRHPIERADVVEISDGVLNVDSAFAEHNYQALRDARVNVYIDDAQSFLQTVPRRYDVIISEPSNPWIAGIAGLFTAEFFEIARHKLEPGGVFALWFHEYDQSDQAVRLILRTFHSVFPHVSLFAEQQYRDIVAIGSVEPMGIDPAALEDRFDRPQVRNDLARIGIANLVALLSHHAVSSRIVPEIIGEGPINSATHQRLEYMAVRAMFDGESSGIAEKANPFLRRETGTLVDAYIQYRDGVGEPVRAAELESAASHMSTRGQYAVEHKTALTLRAELAPADVPTATRAARGAPPDPGTAGYYESMYWAREFAGTEDSMLATAFAQRAAVLLERSQTLPDIR